MGTIEKLNDTTRTHVCELPSGAKSGSNEGPTGTATWVNTSRTAKWTPPTPRKESLSHLARQAQPQLSVMASRLPRIIRTAARNALVGLGKDYGTI